MILEVAILRVKKELVAQFEIDFLKAGKHIRSIQGYMNHSLQKCMEDECKYILLVNWQKIENHTVDFRNSSAYLEWKKLLHHYYDPFPTVEHYTTVIDF